MKSHTPQFKQELIKMGKEIDSIITYGQTTLHDELYAVTPMFEANILKSVMKELDIESSVDIPLETVINYQLGVKVNNSYEYLDYGNYVVYKSEKQEDTDTYKITCYDKMLYAMKQYEELEVTYPITIKNYLIALAEEIGLQVKDTNFYNYSLSIHQDLYKDLEYTYRDVLDEIAQATGSIICINENDQIEVKYPTISGDTIDENYLKDINVTFGQKYGPINSVVLSRAGESDNVYIKDQESIEENGLCEVKIVDNQIMNFNDRSDYLQGLLNALEGFYYYINDFNSIGILYNDVGDLYNIQIGEDIYQCCMLNDEINVTSGIEEIIHTDMPEQSETDYSKADKTDRRINQTYIIVDKQNQTIESVVSNVTEQDNKISQITQTVDELNAKISDISDITEYGESSYASVELNNINASEPVMLKVHPTTDNISLLYPRSNLYPSSSLYMPIRKVRFTRTYQEGGETLTENIDYELPDDLLYYSSTVYDEFYLDYDSHTCQITKRCKYNADGTVSALATEVVNAYEYPLIELGDGNYTISILNYQYGYLFVRLVAKNIYTSQFYTKVETESKISQAVDSINLSVSQTLSNYSTTNEMQSAINLKATEITSSVSQTYETKSDAQTTYNTVSASLSLKVDKSDNGQIISMINASADVITLAGGSSINLSTAGKLKITAGNFKLDSSGNITAVGGKIGGWSISSDALYKGSNDHYFGTGITATIGGTSRSNIILKAGANFGVNNQGYLYANSAVLTNLDASGKITATDGKIGGWNIGTTDISASSGNMTAIISNLSSANHDFLVVRTGTSGNYQYPFYVRGDGSLVATNATITGTFTANTQSNIPASSIKSGTIPSDRLTGVSANFGTLGASAVNAMTVGADYIEANREFECQGSSGITDSSVWIEVGTGSGTAWKQFVFKGGILVAIN